MYFAYIYIFLLLKFFIEKNCIQCCDIILQVSLTLRTKTEDNKPFDPDSEALSLGAALLTHFPLKIFSNQPLLIFPAMKN